ncbi:hypothetical protein [Thalassotalea piscium]|uniref:Uncharacterized protein n=1 Tax=Thalassotalea piscium TaxID=1230533 RepID=A0A7X0NGN1_9GAMM|nr:hypothetical protein [Thalassotalea piscium]MBB6543115.1 hypothetical protein [Thalassotalea piscium]
MANLLKAHLGYLHRRERRLLKKADKNGLVDIHKLNRAANRKRKQAREVIFLA